MISALAWVPRGAAKPVAEEADPADVDLATSQVNPTSLGAAQKKSSLNSHVPS